MNSAYITEELKAFNLADHAIDQMTSEYLNLRISGIEDKEGYSAVHEARMIVKKHRVSIIRILQDY